MTAAEVREACGELEPWLPVAQALTTQPDTDGTRSHGKPSSRPPWNAAAEYALMDALEGLRRLRADLLFEVTGRRMALAPMAATGATLTAIVNLSEAVDGHVQREGVVLISRWTKTILQLPAIDKDERWEKVRGGDCPYCKPQGFANTLWWKSRSGLVACFRGYGSLCTDANGLPPVGLMGRSGLDGTPVIAWSDGLVT